MVTTHAFYVCWIAAKVYCTYRKLDCSALCLKNETLLFRLRDAARSTSISSSSEVIIGEILQGLKDAQSNKPGVLFATSAKAGCEVVEDWHTGKI